MTELEKNHIDQHKTLIAKLESVDVSMYQDGYELGYKNGVDAAAFRIAELEAAFKGADAKLLHYDIRIAELEAKLRTMSELEEQHLAEIDRQAERIKELQVELAATKSDNATLAGLALDATNIFSYTEPLPDSEAQS